MKGFPSDYGLVSAKRYYTSREERTRKAKTKTSITHKIIPRYTSYNWCAKSYKIEYGNCAKFGKTKTEARSKVNYSIKMKSKQTEGAGESRKADETKRGLLSLFFFEKEKIFLSSSAPPPTRLCVAIFLLPSTMYLISGFLHTRIKNMSMMIISR